LGLDYPRVKLGYIGLLEEIGCGHRSTISLVANPKSKATKQIHTALIELAILDGL
jgi:hypothetical protein